MADAHRADVKAALEKAGYRPTQAARTLKVSRSCLSQAIDHRNPTPFWRLKKGVAALIGVPPQSLWPSLFDAKGRPTPQQHHRRPKDTRSRAAREVSARIQGDAR